MNRFCDAPYYCVAAHDMARRRLAKLARRVELRAHVVAKLRTDWSPQSIAGRLKRAPTIMLPAVAA